MKKQLKKRSGGSDGEHLDCPICLECLKYAVETSCGHCFCAGCITQYLAKRRDCPVCRREIASVHPSYTLRRVVEAHLKRESIPFEEGYSRNQHEADKKLQEIFKNQRTQTKHTTIILYGIIVVGIVLVIALGFGSGRVTISTKKNAPATTHLSPEQQLHLKQFQEETIPQRAMEKTIEPQHPGESRLRHLASAGDLASLIRLLEGASTIKDELSHALIDAARGGHHEVVKLLLKHGADLSAKKFAGLIESSKEGHFLVVSALLDAGALPNSAMDDNFYAIHYAAEQGHTGIVKKLLDAGAGVNTLSVPYPPTARSGHTECVRVLLKRGAMPDAKSTENATPLYVAAEYGKTEVLKLLQGAGASIETHMQSGATPLVIAAQKNYREIVEFLLRKGAQTGIVGAKAMNSLHLASSNGHVECVRMLLEAAASADEVDDDGNTALHYAVHNVHKATRAQGQGNSEVLGPLVSSVSLLLRHGANPSPPPNKNGESVESYFAQSQVLTRAFAGVKRVECKIIPANTMDVTTIMLMNSISTLHEVLLRVESAYLQRVSDIATGSSGEVARVSDIDASTTFLSELADAEGTVIIRVFFKKPLKS